MKDARGKSDRPRADDERHHVSVHLGVLVALGLFTIFLMVLLWSVLNHRSFQFETHHRRTLEEELPSIVALSHGTLVEGNQVELGHNGEFFTRLLASIAAARETIHLESFVWWSGEICGAVARALAAKADQGLEVRLLLDWAGGRKIDPALLQTLRDAGVEVVFFHRPTLRSLGRFNARTHRKIAVIDGRTAFVFGHGFAQEWTGDAEDRAHYRDTFVVLHGPIVNRIQAVFFENWLEETRKLPFGEQYFPEIEPAGTIATHVAYLSSTGDVSAVETLYYGVVAAATREVLIQNPYFVVEGLGIALFKDAVARGVRVRVMVPSVAATDAAIVQHASHRHFQELLEAGVEIYEYERTLLHQKVMIVDGLWSTVGSANFDDRSFELSDEIQVGIVDPGIASQLAAAWEEDLRFARRIDLATWKSRGWWHRLKDRLAYTINEQL
jgi:cardiolipin synthase